MNPEASVNKPVTISLRPSGYLGVLSRAEIGQLLDGSQGGLYQLFRSSSLAVLSCGSETDNASELLAAYPDFNIEVSHRGRGIKLHLYGAPDSAFVDGRIISGISDLLFAVLRDIIYVHMDFNNNSNFDLQSSAGITDVVFHILRNAGITTPITRLKTVVCWGGHSIPRHEYDYTKEVGYQLGLRGFNVCTGCGPGAMKGPMKGAAVAHSKQRIKDGLYIGISEPGIIAAEAPNPIVNSLVILPDIEKRLEAFLRVGHGIIVFPGGVGTMEELLYLLGILMQPENGSIPFPVVLTGPADSVDYFAAIDEFIKKSLGDEAANFYEIVIGDPILVAQRVKSGIRKVRQYRMDTSDAYYFNWQLNIPLQFQLPFIPTHENMSSTVISKKLPKSKLAANLRCIFSGIVAGNVKADGVRAIKEYGKFQIQGDAELLMLIDGLLKKFVSAGRMKLPGKAYEPCYTIANF
ncbi:MAG: putative Rossmann-fold nucleotide-binding protein [Parasphingorhabdus sp.]